MNDQLCVERPATILLGTGDRVRSVSGRACAPVPRVAVDTGRKTTLSIQRLAAWLRDEAIAEATGRHEGFAAACFTATDPKRLTASDYDAMNVYLFGDEGGPQAHQLIARGK